ncbi:MAG: hypothetical protein BA871_15005 [Desulfuromonadales bacterium C00003096]|nr:MAG: hypothetical protein BA871_15005 [Desulfuromonadales bacterium C00003096]
MITATSYPRGREKATAILFLMGSICLVGLWLSLNEISKIKFAGPGRQRVTQRCCRCVIDFKPNNLFVPCWEKNRTDSFSNQLSEEGLRKEISAAVGWLQGY